MIIPVILSGGVGSRLWPLSRKAHPKPFIELDNGQSLLQKTYQRAVFVSQPMEVITVTNRDHFFYTKDQYEELGGEVIQNIFISEPVGRNSTAAIALAAQYIATQRGEDPLLLVLSADHLIKDEAAFSQAVSQAVQLASKDKLVTFGIQPTSPETGFGYIKSSGICVEEFIEKPDRKTAEAYINSGSYLWNSGMFCMRAGCFLNELSAYAPDIAAQVSRCLLTAKQSSGEGWRHCEVKHVDFEEIPSISVDRAIFEKSQNIAVVACDIGWSDIGSWPELGALYPTDQRNNNIKGEVICEETKNCIVHGSQRLIATLGISDLVIADTSDALLVAHKDYTQDVRTIVDELKSREHPSYKEFDTMHRPWGTYTVLQEGIGFKLKRIEVKPGGRLSLQSHKYRSEHWVVVSGKARVTNEDTQIELESNQSTYISVGNRHRLENAGPDTLIVIEVQCGEYLGEDDIMRYEDCYGR